MIEIIFWASFALIFYTYIGYPVQLCLQARLFPKPVAKAKPGDYFPTVSVVVAARNEEERIQGRIRNLTAQEYPSDRLEVIIVSDGSTDNTNQKVQQLIKELSVEADIANLKLIKVESSQGKPHALNLGVADAQSEIIVFADCRQKFKPDVIKNLVANFHDPRVGCASGELIFLENKESDIQAEMGAYWKYEKLIRKAESRSGSVVGATGAIYAIRRDAFEVLPAATLLDDVLTPLNISFQGYRVIFDPSAVAFDVVSKEVSQEFRRKVRTLAGNWQLLSLEPGLLKLIKNPLLWRILAHKMARLVVPFALPVLFFSGAILEGMGFTFFSLLQFLFYLLAALAWLFVDMRKLKLINLSYFFMVLNCAALAGFWRWASGNCATAWHSGTAVQGTEG